MCARPDRSLPLYEAEQLNIAALASRWIDGHCHALPLEPAAVRGFFKLCVNLLSGVE